ncbi:uncharacterized protein LY79DRAFT_196094 [Colletotrichum navitas]|uniref:Uncharacterized protein n=1 Tax=Colletotrichum navitas TaxID=681940 RepID=A0AAD8Q0E7_9PEZI|nr:uncharacterized protein LY79DRAFT_196094 [Colletotrichum navitas]KAK1590919.1 hypothetical protein LY79DRAFT_196094 [Colletotrichum navitas]
MHLPLVFFFSSCFFRPFLRIRLPLYRIGGHAAISKPNPHRHRYAMNPLFMVRRHDHDELSTPLRALRALLQRPKRPRRLPHPPRLGRLRRSGNEYAYMGRYDGWGGRWDGIGVSTAMFFSRCRCLVRYIMHMVDSGTIGISKSRTHRWVPYSSK